MCKLARNLLGPTAILALISYYTRPSATFNALEALLMRSTKCTLLSYLLTLSRDIDIVISLNGKLRNDIPNILNRDIFGPTELWTAVHQRSLSVVNGHISPVSLTCHLGRDSDRLPPTNFLYHCSTSPPSANGLFRLPAPPSGTVFHGPPHVTSAPSLAIFRQRQQTFLFHLSYLDLIFWFASCFIVDLAIIFVI